MGAGATDLLGFSPYYSAVVSILTRPWGRVQQTKHIHIGASHPFQSSPARGGGCNHHRLTTAHRPHAFQSSPARGGGCNILEGIAERIGRVPFQSSPARGGGCNASGVSSAKHLATFQSSPARGGGCNLLVGPANEFTAKFQSSPACGGGCNALRQYRYSELEIVPFQSSPARGGGCNARTLAITNIGASRFQSSPARGGGCNIAHEHARPREPLNVSILTRPWGRVQRGLENARERFPKRKCSSCQGVPCRALGG